MVGIDPLCLSIELPPPDILGMGLRPG